MHRIWTVPELLDIILKQMEKSDQPEMALVCKAFWPPTARVVWEVVPSISDLLALCPDDKQHSRAAEAEHCPRSSGWERFQFYAAFVRDLTASITHDTITSLQELKSSSKQTVVLPNLQRIRLNFKAGLPQPGVEQVHLLLPPSIRVLRCTCNLKLSPKDETTATIVESLRCVPFIESFSILSVMPEHIASRLGPALSSMSRLQSVLLWIETGLPIEVVQALSQVQTLESVLLGVIHDEAQPPSSNQSLTYFSAKNLRYVAQRKALSWLLPLTMSSNVEALSILFSPSDENFDGLGSPVDYPNLTTLKVSFILQWSELTPLLAFRGLKELSITPAFDWEEHWSTSETRLLVESFPLLEVLVLGDGPNSFDVLLTLPDLDCFARHCPRLWYLGASIDARAVHTFTGTVTPHPAIREVDLQESEAAEHEAEFEVAGLIKRLWPNLQKGSRMYHDTLPGEEPWGQESIKAFWDNVWSLMDFAEPDGRFDYTCTKMYEISLVDF